MTVKKKAFGSSLFLLQLLMISCSDTITDPNTIVFPDKGISYNRTIQPLFNLKCATSGCHDTETQANGLNLSSYYEARFSKPGVIIPRDTVLSRLIWSIEARPGSAPMPPTSSLTINQIKGFRQWIMEGATDSIP